MGTIDSDAHVIETMTTFDYIEPEYRHLKPRVVRQVEGDHVKSNEGGAQKEFWIIDGRLQPKEHNVGSNTSDVSREMRDARGRIGRIRNEHRCTWCGLSLSYSFNGAAVWSDDFPVEWGIWIGLELKYCCAHRRVGCTNPQRDGTQQWMHLTTHWLVLSNPLRSS